MTVISRDVFIRAKAVSILKRHKVSRPPVPLYNIVTSEGIQVVYLFNRPDLESGVTVRKASGDYEVFLNISGDEKWDNWNLAIQYGHIVLGHFQLFTADTVAEDRLKTSDRKTLNQESEVFAQEVLAPSYLLLPLAKKRKHGAIKQHVFDACRNFEKNVDCSKKIKIFLCS